MWNWISSELDEQDARSLYSSLSRVVQRKELTPCFAWKLLNVAVESDTPRSNLELKAGLNISKLLLTRFDGSNFQQEAKSYLSRVVDVCDDQDVEARAKNLLKTL